MTEDIIDAVWGAAIYGVPIYMGAIVVGYIAWVGISYAVLHDDLRRYQDMARHRLDEEDREP